MNFDTLEASCNRAFAHSLDKKKIIVCAGVLCLCGLIVIFSTGLSVSAHAWLAQSLTFVPLFLSIALLSVLGVIMARAYHHEVKKREVCYTTIVKSSWQLLLIAFSCFLPFILAYLVLWVTLGIFLLLREIPFIGDFFGVILAFGPFLIYVFSCLFLIVSCYLLFTIIPVLALQSIQPRSIVPYVISVCRSDFFLRIVLMCVAFMPVVVVSVLLWIAAYKTSFIYFVQENQMQMMLQWFFILPPFALLLSIPVLFLFNMSCEAHVISRKKLSH